MLHLSQRYETSLNSFKRFDPNDWDQLSKRITFRLMNKKVFSATYDEDILHQNCLDLTKVFIVSELSDDRKYISSYDLKEKDLENFNKDEKDLFTIISDNIKNDATVRIQRFTENITAREVMYPLIKIPSNSSIASSSSSLIQDFSEKEDKDNILILTNKYNVYGASHMFNFKALSEVYNRIKGNFYIVPTSIHEVMCVSEDYVCINKTLSQAEDDLLDMLYEMNDKNDDENVLSYKIYKYYADDGHILMPIKQSL